MELPTITLAWLRERHACGEQVRLFRAHFGDSAEINEDNAATAVELGFDLDWLAEHLVPVPAWVEYKRARAPAWAEYQHVEASAWAEYDSTRASAWVEHDGIRVSALAKYNRIRASAWAEYERAVARSIMKLARGVTLATEDARPTPAE